MANHEIHAVTGAYGYSGKYIAGRLLGEGRTVITLTNSPSRANPFGERIKARPFHFDRPDLLAEELQGVAVLYNTYWVRFNPDGSRYADAVHNTSVLFSAAKQAGVRRIVHVSITNASEDSPLQYFRDKAVVEKALIQSGISYAILRPAVLFGEEDILINNIAWTLRRLPIFGIFGDGRYRLQPIYVDDLAGLAVEQGERRENLIIDAIGPETFCYREPGGHDRSLDRPRASHHFCAAAARSRRQLDHGEILGRRGGHQGRDRGVDGQSVVCRCATCRGERA